MSIDIKVNRLPARTWNWLQMNESRLSQIEAKGICKVEMEGKTAETPWIKERFDSIDSGMGGDMTRLVKQNGAAPLHLAAAAGSEETVKLHFSFADGEESGRTVDLSAEEGGRLTVIMDYTSQKNAAGLGAVQTRLRAGRNAVIRLVQLQLLGEGYTLLNDIGGVCADGGEIQVLQLFLGAAKTFAGCRVELNGSESRLMADIGYFGRREQMFDMNYAAIHRGKKSQSLMKADGILKDASSKLFRQTIDFKKGASGAQGDEREEVLLLSDDAVNRSIPLILCGEEDVKGNHGATVGRLDEDLMFYLCSRGMSETDVCNMIARARMDALCRKIGDAAAEEQLQQFFLQYEDTNSAIRI